MAAPSKALPRVHAAPATTGVWLLRLLLVLFFLSGISGLVYQALWVRIPGLVFGVTIFAVSTVPAGFFLVGSLGIRSTTNVAAAINLLVGLGALLAARALVSTGDTPAVRAESSAAETGAGLRESARASEARNSGALRLVFWAFGI